MSEAARSAQLVDPGLEGWGGELATGESEIDRAESDFTVRPGGLPVVEVGYVPWFADRGLLLDARPAAKVSHPAGATAGLYVGSASEWTADPSRVLVR